MGAREIVTDPRFDWFIMIIIFFNTVRPFPHFRADEQGLRQKRLQVLIAMQRPGVENPEFVETMENIFTVHDGP